MNYLALNKHHGTVVLVEGTIKSITKAGSAFVLKFSDEPNTLDLIYPFKEDKEQKIADHLNQFLNQPVFVAGKIQLVESRGEFRIILNECKICAGKEDPCENCNGSRIANFWLYNNPAFSTSKATLAE
jgi:hypothetical protein